MERERQLLNLKIAEDLNYVKIKFSEIDPEETDDPEDIDINKFTAESTRRPHKDFVDSLKKLRKHGLAILGIKLDDEAKQLRNWTVSAIKISGDMLLKQSRVVMTLSLRSDLTGKITPIKVSQVTMYPKADEKVKYHDADKMTAVIEEISQEAWSYIFKGKYEKGTNPQLALFAEKVLLKVAS